MCVLFGGPFGVPHVPLQLGVLGISIRRQTEDCSENNDTQRNWAGLLFCEPLEFQEIF